MLLILCLQWQTKNPPALPFESNSHKMYNYNSLDIHELSVIHTHYMSTDSSDGKNVTWGLDKLYWDGGKFPSQCSSESRSSRITPIFSLLTLKVPTKFPSNLASCLKQECLTMWFKQLLIIISVIYIFAF